MLIGFPVRAVARPESDQPPKILEARPLVRNCFAVSEGQFPDAIDGKGVAHVDVAAAAVASAAGHVLEAYARARAVGGVGDPVGPHVVGLEQQAARGTGAGRWLASR